MDEDEVASPRLDAEPAPPSSPLEAASVELVEGLVSLCDVAQNRLFDRLQQFIARLVRCERATQRSIHARNALDEKQRVAHEREVDELETQVAKLQQQLRRERHERAEEKEWLAQLWPDGFVLPTLLKPFEASNELSLVKDAADSEHLQAQVNRRVARERVRRQIEIAQQWKAVVSPATTNPDTGDVTPESVYFTNTVTGESVWQAPLAMVFEPPPQWDHSRMDWKEGHGIEHFYDTQEAAKSSSGEHADSSDEDVKRASGATGSAHIASKAPAKRRNSVASDGVGDDQQGDNRTAEEDDGDDSISETEDKPLDPIALREQMTVELEKHKQLESELAKTQGRQRSLALQLLNASRECFEHEKEALEVEDEELKTEERKKRRALLQEQAAAKAKAEALEKKSSTSVQAKFGKDSVGKKDMALTKDDEAFEQELEMFVLQARADRAYLALPVSLDPRVKLRHQLDEEYVHMKTMEARVLEIEQLEFDLLEKSSLRHEEAEAKSESVAELCEQVRVRQPEVDQDIAAVLKTIARLEIPLPPPPEPRPSGDELERASGRFVTLAPLEDDGGNDERESASGDKSDNSVSASTRSHERASMAAEVASEGMTKEEIEALLKDEAELRLFKSFVDAEQHWRDWEKEEAMRVAELARAMERKRSLEHVQRQLASDLALYESDAPFFASVARLEKEANARMWQIQADTQIERVRFTLERAAREEAVLQMDDRLKELKAHVEAAQRLPIQALNVLERLELEEASRVLCESLEMQVRELQDRHVKELQAKALLVELETRLCTYAHQKLAEEATLLSEKQALWELNVALEDAMRAERKTIERLHLLLEDLKPLQSPSDDAPEATQRQELKQELEVTTAVLASKRQLLQHARQFLLLCYDRESRWRTLASVALVKDTSSDEWMTRMQRERHEGMLAILREQHDAEVLELKAEITLLHKTKAELLTQIDELHAKIDRMRCAYQESSEHVRLQTESVVLVLNEEIEKHKLVLRDEQQYAQRERERLIGEHDGVREDLERRLLELEDVNEQQRHWLTAARRELTAQRTANDELLKAYQSLEKRRAAETNDMRFRIASQVRKISNIEMWNLSLKLKAKEASAERVRMQQEREQLVAQHKQQLLLLRQKNWRHRVTAQALLTDVDLLFRFFADGLEILSGATRETNARLRANGAIEVLAQLVQHCHQDHIKMVCAKALGLLSWNANATPRALGWQAKRKWFSWVATQSDAVLEKLAQQNTSFDAVADETSVETNWFVDPSDAVGAGESDCDVVSRTGKKLQFLKSWHQFDELRFPDENSSNQERIGLSPSILKTIVDLCRPPSAPEDADDPAAKQTRLQIQRNALLSLALVVMNTRNTAIIGRMDGSIPLLVELMAPKEPREDAQVVRTAIRALSNLAFENSFNQLAIAAHGGVPHLLAYCSDSTDVDLVLVATQALVHLSQQETSVCEAIFSADGVPLLARLCHSPRIYDTVELDVYEQIQTHAAQVIANIVTALDNVDNESGHRSRSVATAIMEADAAEAVAAAGRDRGRAIGGVTSFVLMCASCTRDVAYHATLVLGSIAQHDPIRAAIGDAGGIDALFLLADRPGDAEMVVQATWALANLTWNRDNQYRVARYLDRLFSICTFPATQAQARTPTVSTNQEQEERGSSSCPELEDDDTLARQIREHGLCILANALFYNDANRQLVASQRKWMELLQRNCIHGRDLTLEHSARALCSLSYSDAIALAMGTSCALDSSSSSSWALPLSGLEVFIRLCGCAANVLVQRNGLFGVINLCLHDANKTRMLDVPHGIETLVNLSGHASSDICNPALEALELLADVRQLKTAAGVSSSSSSLAATDMKKLVALLSEATSPAIVAMVSDAIADEVWNKSSAKVKLRNEHGLEKLLELCVTPLDAVLGASHALRADQEHTLLLSCLWALRNAVIDNVRNQDLVGALGGVEQLVTLYDRQKRSEDIVEAILATLVALARQHPRNSQQLVHFGLDMLIALADGGSARDEDERDRTVLPPLVPSKKQADSSDRTPYHELQNAALARDLLHLVAPYNTPPAAGASASSSPDKLSKLRRFQQHQQQHQQQQG